MRYLSYRAIYVIIYACMNDVGTQYAHMWAIGTFRSQPIFKVDKSQISNPNTHKIQNINNGVCSDQFAPPSNRSTFIPCINRNFRLKKRLSISFHILIFAIFRVDRKITRSSQSQPDIVSYVPPPFQIRVQTQYLTIIR